MNSSTLTHTRGSIARGTSASLPSFPSFVSTHDTITPSPETGGRSGYIPPLLSGFGRWIPSTESDPEARALYRRHLACRERVNGHRGKLFPGAGERMILITPQADALIVFRRVGDGIHCSVFRNEGHFRSCSLIREAVEEWSWKRWPGERLYTYVHGCRVVSTNPGYAFRCAGWRRCGVAIDARSEHGGGVGVSGVIVMECVPPHSPSPSPPP